MTIRERRSRSIDHHHRPRAADLATAVRPAMRTFPRSAATSAIRTTRALRQINRPRPAARRGVAQPHRRRPDHRHEPEHAGRRRWRDLYRISARQRHRGRRHAPASPNGSTRRRAATSRDAASPSAKDSSTRSRATTIVVALEQGHRRRSSGNASTRASATSRRSRSSTTAARLFIGTNDGDRGAALALDATTGDKLWHFWGAPGPGEFGNDTWEGDSWQEGGATPWIHPAIDPDLGTVYFTFGNVRAGSSQDGSTRGGDNLFANSIVALDLNTGAYKWHFQSIHHDIWDMDNVMAPVLVDARIRGRDRKLDRLRQQVRDVLHPRSPRRQRAARASTKCRCRKSRGRRHRPTQPFPRQGGWTENCVVDQPLGTSIPGNPNRAVPNYERGCLYAAHWDVPHPVDSRAWRRRRLESSFVQPEHRPRCTRASATSPRRTR